MEQSRKSRNRSELLTIEGRDVSVGIATCYRLDGPRIQYGCVRRFPHPSSPAMGPT